MMTSSLPLAPVIVTNSSPAKSHGSKIPFENSRTMDECRVEVLRAFRKEIVTTVKFGDVSRVLIACGLVSKEECFEICKLPMPKQMTQCYQKVHDIMDILVCQKVTASEQYVRNGWKENRLGSERLVEETDKQNGLVKDIWKNFIGALRQEHGQLAGKMENELDKSAESRLLMKRGSGGSTRSLLKKEDIGSPHDFQHVKHYGLISDKRNRRYVSRVGREQGDGAPKSPDEVLEHASGPVIPLDGQDADLNEFFKRAGVASRHLLNPVTKQIIVRFISENGGMNAIREEVRQGEPSTPPPPVNVTNGSSNDDSTSSPPQTNHYGSTSSSGGGGGGTTRRIAKIFRGRSSSETQLAKRDNDRGESNAHGEPPPAPATVPFQPTPRPTSNLFYF